MTMLRPDCHSKPDHRGVVVRTRLELLRHLLTSVNKRRTLIRGKLDDGDKHCAMGCFFADHPTWAVSTDLIDEIASVNDELSERAMPKTRWKKVQRWLRLQLDIYEAAL
jgi:hypothetical protein